MAVTLSDLIVAYRDGLMTAAVDAFADVADTDSILICRGDPGPDQPDDIVSVGRPGLTSDPATMSSNLRTRELLMTVQVLFSVFRGGGPEAEEAVMARVVELVSALERQVRVGDITLGGVVRECYLTSFDPDQGVVGESSTTPGRVAEIPATFTAKARLTER